MNRESDEQDAAEPLDRPTEASLRAERILGRADLGYVSVLVAFVLVYLAPFLLQNQALFQIGNDFTSLYSNYATYFVDAVRAGFIPWWNPNEGGGYPFFSNPFTAFFYPGRVVSFLIAARSPLYSWYHHQIFTVFGVLLMAAGYYVWLRGRRAEHAASFFAAGVIAVGYRVADIYRFPNAIHAAAWMPWILFAYDRWIDRELGRGFLLGTFALLCLATAGYPYYTVYAAVLVAAYVMLRVAEGVPARRAVVALASLVAPAALIALPYYGSMARLLRQTVDRGGGQYEYSTFHAWAFLDLIGGFVFPPSSVSEGWLYCGLLPVLIIAAWVALSRTMTRPFAWALAMILLVQLLASSGQSFVFPAIWSFVPGISTLRVWPRMTIVTLPPLALMIAMAYSGIASLPRRRRIAQSAVWRIALAVAAVQVVLWMTKSFSTYFVAYFSYMQPIAFVVATFVAAIYLSAWLLSSRRIAPWWAIVALTVTASDTGTFGRQIWRAAVGTPVPAASLDLPGYYARFFEVPRAVSVAGMLIPYMPTGSVLENWYYVRYATFLKAYSGQPSFAHFMGDNGRKLFFSPTLDAPPAEFEAWWQRVAAFESAAGATAAPIEPYNGNVLRLRYRSSMPGYLIFVDNWDPDWRAAVNGRSAALDPAFGTFKAVRVSPGTGTVTFEYHQRLPYWGLSVAGLLLVPIIGWLGGPMATRRRRTEGRVSALTSIR